MSLINQTQEGLHEDMQGETTMNDHAALGALAQLPIEVRVLIWKFLMPECRSRYQPPGSEAYSVRSTTRRAPPRAGKRLSILRTCRQLREEISSELYKNRNLFFSIDSTKSGWTIDDLPGAVRRDSDMHVSPISRGWRSKCTPLTQKILDNS